MSLYSKLFVRQPKALTVQQFADLDRNICAVHAKAGGKAGAFQNGVQMRRSPKGVHLEPAANDKKSLRDAAKARQLAIAHLNVPANQKRYGKDNAELALASLNKLQATCGHEQLYEAMKPVSTAEQRALTKDMAQLVQQDLVHLRADGTKLPEMPSHAIDWAAPDAGDQARDAARVWGLAFKEACEYRGNESGPLMREKSGMHEQVRQLFGPDAPPTLMANTLHDELVLLPLKRIQYLSVRLDDLIGLVDTGIFPRGAAALDQAILKLTKELMDSVITYQGRLARVGNGLTNGLAPKLTGDLHGAATHFGSSLVNLSRICARPDGFVMKAYARAQEHALAASQRCTGEQIRLSAYGVLKSVEAVVSADAAPPTVADAPADPAQEAARQRYEAAAGQAQVAGNLFDGLGPVPQGGAAPGQPLGLLTQRLRQAMSGISVIATHFDGEPDLFALLLQDFPQLIQEQVDALKAEKQRLAANPQDQTVEAYEQLARQSQELIGSVNDYVTATALAAHVLVNLVQRDDLPLDAQGKTVGFASALAELAVSMADPASPWMGLLSDAKAVHQAAVLRQAELSLPAQPVPEPPGAEPAPRKLSAEGNAALDDILDQLLDDSLTPRRVPAYQPSAQAAPVSDEQMLAELDLLITQERAPQPQPQRQWAAAKPAQPQLPRRALRPHRNVPLAQPAKPAPAPSVQLAEAKLVIERAQAAASQQLRGLHDLLLAPRLNRQLTPLQRGWKASLAQGLLAHRSTAGLDPQMLLFSLPIGAKAFEGRYAEMAKLTEGHSSAGNRGVSDARMLEIGKRLRKSIERHLVQLQLVGELLVHLADQAQAEPAIANPLREAGRSLLALEQVQRGPLSPLVQMSQQAQAWELQARERQNAVPAVAQPVKVVA